MKRYIKDIVYLGIILIISVVLLKQCNTHISTASDVIVKHTVDTTYIVSQSEPVYVKGNTIHHHDTTVLPLVNTIDTDAVIKRFYTQKVYLDTITLHDNNGSVFIKDSIYMNNLLSRTWNANINKMIIHDSVTIKDAPRNQLYLGGTIGFIKPNIPIISPSIFLKTKKDDIYGLSIDIVSPGISVTMLKKLSFRRR